MGTKHNANQKCINRQNSLYIWIADHQDIEAGRLTVVAGNLSEICVWAAEYNPAICFGDQ